MAVWYFIAYDCMVLHCTCLYGTSLHMTMVLHCTWLYGTSLHRAFHYHPFIVLIYRIRPNYHTVRLGFSKLLQKLVIKYVSTYTKGTLKSQRKTYLMMPMWFFFSDFLYKRIIYCGFSFELHQQVDAIQIGTHNICFYKEVDKKYTGCNLKTTELLDCALIGVCALIRSNTVTWIILKGM